MRLVKIIGIMILFCCISQNDIYSKTRKITLEECISIAVQNHPDLRIQDENYNKAVARYRLARSERNLSINASILTKEFNLDAASDTTIAGKDTDIGVQIGIAATYNIYNRKKEKQEKMARVSLDIAKNQKKKERDEIIYNVKKAFYSYLMAKESMVLNKQLYLNNLEKLKLAKNLFKKGLRPILDVSKAEVGYAEGQLEYEKAKNQNRSARIQLFMSMGIQDSGADIVPISTETLPTIKFTYDELLKLAHLYNSDLKSIAINKEISKIKIDIARSDRYPVIRFDLLFGYENSSLYRNDSFEGIIDGENWEIKIAPSLRFILPIYNGGAVSANIDHAKSEYNESIYQERQVVLLLENNILNDIKLLDELIRQIEMSELIIENAKKHLLLATKSYENGSGTILDLQDAQTRVIQAELGFLQAKFRYLLTIAQIANRIGLEEDYLCINSTK